MKVPIFLCLRYLGTANEGPVFVLFCGQGRLSQRMTILQQCDFHSLTVREEHLLYDKT